MPELPEVETMRRHIEHSLAGKVLRRLEIRLERVVLWPSGLGPGELEGATLRSARRRAKWLLLEFDNGLSLAVHFGLTGQLFHDGPQGKAMLGHPVPALDVPRPHKEHPRDFPLRRRLDSSTTPIFASLDAFTSSPPARSRTSLAGASWE